MCGTSSRSVACRASVKLAVVLLPCAILAQKHRPSDDWPVLAEDHITRSFNVTSASNPKKVLVDNITGSIHVTTHPGSDVLMKAHEQIRAESQEALAEAKRDVKLDITQQGNYVRIYLDGPFRHNDGINYRGDRYYGYHVEYDYDLEVPADTELILKTVNRGDIEVAHTTADFELSNINGGIKVDGVAGSGSVNTINGPITVSFTRNPARPSSFKTINGQIDIHFQPNISADMRFKTFNGHVYTDFEVNALPVPAGETESKNGRFIYRGNRSTMGRVGTGGPELSFETLNGDVRLHNKN